MHRSITGRITTALVAAAVAAASFLGSSPSLAAAEPESRGVNDALTADYRLGNSLASSVGIAPDLEEVGPGIGGFGSETLDGTTRVVYQFPKGNGLAVNDVTTVIGRGRYTIVLLMRFDRVKSYRRIINFAGRTKDTGLYVYYRKLYLYSSLEAPGPRIDADEWVQVVLTRTRGGEVKGYVDGELLMTVDDSTDRFAVVSGRDVLQFFRDDTNREESAGSVARIRLFDRPLSEAKVAALGELPPLPDVRPEAHFASPGDTLTVDVAEFGPFEAVKVYFRDGDHGWRYAGQVTVDRSGAGSLEVKVRNDTTLGSGRILAVGATSGLRRARPFTYVATEG